MHPLAVYLPFNRESLLGTFAPAKQTGTPPDRRGHWLIIQESTLLVTPDGTGTTWRLPEGPLPEGLEGKVGPAVWLGTYRGAPCWAASLAADAQVPTGLQQESLLPLHTRLTDDVLSLGGMALHALHWEETSRCCPRCGEVTQPIENEWGKKCPRCAYEHYPHLHPAVIVLVRDGDRALLTRKSFWSPGRYGLVAGFVDLGESLEAAARREVREEVGLEIRELQYVGSQYWPFPSQLMVGFTAAYAGGEIVVDKQELEDAAWFSVHDLPPNLPPKLSIARFLIDHCANPESDR